MQFRGHELLEQPESRLVVAVLLPTIIQFGFFILQPSSQLFYSIGCGPIVSLEALIITRFVRCYGLPILRLTV
jgi:hypothetical protein